MAKASIQVQVDTTLLVQQLQSIASALPVFPKAGLEHFTDLILGLCDGHIPECCIGSCSTTSSTGDHVIRLRAAGDLELLGTALGAFESD